MPFFFFSEKQLQKEFIQIYRFLHRWSFEKKLQTISKVCIQQQPKGQLTGKKMNHAAAKLANYNTNEALTPQGAAGI